MSFILCFLLAKSGIVRSLKKQARNQATFREMAGLGVKHLGWLRAEVADAALGPGTGTAQWLQQETPLHTPPPAEPGVPNTLLSFRERHCDLRHPKRPSSKQELGSAAPRAKQTKVPINPIQRHHRHQTIACAHRSSVDDRNVLAS